MTITTSSMRNGSLRWVEIATRAQFRRWLSMTNMLYSDERFVPPIRQSLWWNFKKSTRDTNLLDLRFFALVNSEDRVVARTTIHHNEAINAKLRRKIRLFGFTEFIDDFTVFRRLVDEISSVAAQGGDDSLFGPANFLPNETGGVITSHFEQAGFLDAPYNLPHYPAFYEKADFSPVFAGATYLCEIAGAHHADPYVLFPFDDARIAQEGLVIHRGDRRRLREQLVILRHLLNASFAQRAYYTPLSLKELTHRTEGLNFLMDEDLILYLSRYGEPVAFIICVPDVSQFLVRIKGDLDLINRFRLWFGRKQLSGRAIMIIKGTVPHAQGRGYMTLLARALHQNLMAKDYRELRSTFVETINTASTSQFLRMGGRVLHDVTFYERRVDG
jgi:hypothetical protein